MAAASNKRMTKEKIEVNDKNKKENESVFESNASGKSRQKTSRAGASKKAGHQTAAKTTTRKKTPVKIDITHQRKIQDVTEYRDRLAFETGITLIVIGIVAVFSVSLDLAEWSEEFLVEFALDFSAGQHGLFLWGYL